MSSKILKAKSLAKTTLAGLTSIIVFLIEAVGMLLKHIDSPSSARSEKSDDGVYGYYENSNNAGYHINGALMYVDDEGNHI
jgi:hypothetical protein